MEITTKKDLEEAIIALEKKKVIQHAVMMKHYHQTTDSLKPKNLIKGIFTNIGQSPDAKSGMLKTAVGLGVGILTKKLFLGKSTSLVQKLLGNAVKIGIAKTAISNTDRVKAYASAIYNNLLKKKK